MLSKPEADSGEDSHCKGDYDRAIAKPVLALKSAAQPGTTVSALEFCTFRRPFMTRLSLLPFACALALAAAAAARAEFPISPTIPTSCSTKNFKITTITAEGAFPILDTGRCGGKPC